MAKAMLIMDMPSCCLDCPCSQHNPNIKKECMWECETNGMELDEINLDIERPTWCPLREVPQKKELIPSTPIEFFVKKGHNACIDEILGGAEHG